jgi:ribonuclease P protein component
LKSGDFGAFVKPIHFSGKYIRALVTAATVDCGFKCAFVVSKKVSRLATVRNLIKRRMRHLFIECCEYLPKDRWIIFIALPGSGNVIFNELKEDFKTLCGGICSKCLSGGR